MRLLVQLLLLGSTHAECHRRLPDLYQSFGLRLQLLTDDDFWRINKFAAAKFHHAEQFPTKRLGTARDYITEGWWSRRAYHVLQY